MAVSWRASSGGWPAVMAPSAAAIRLPEPTPAPIASERGSNIPSACTALASTVMKIAPSTVPVMYSPSTPRPSGDCRP